MTSFSRALSGEVELCGVLIGGRQRLRLRLPTLVEKQQAEFRGEATFAPPKRKVGGEDAGGDGSSAPDDASKAAAEAAESSEWSCATCTFRNRPLSLACDMCGSERPYESSADAMAAFPDGGAEAGLAEFEAADALEGGEAAAEAPAEAPAEALTEAELQASFLEAGDSALPELPSALLRSASSKLSAEQVGNSVLAAALLGEEAAASLGLGGGGGGADQGGGGEGGDPHALTEAATNAVLGYPIDKFQVDCLRVIVNPGRDLLAMAPTGSGKTAVALMGILQAFARGKKAV